VAQMWIRKHMSGRNIWQVWIRKLCRFRAEHPSSKTDPIRRIW
jgi:hypothetical protein